LPVFVVVGKFLKNAFIETLKSTLALQDDLRFFFWLIKAEVKE
jgi:hypothetical protein